MDASIDLQNPGEVLACAGLAYLAGREDPLAQTGFSFRDGDTVFEFSEHVLGKLQPSGLCVVPTDDSVRLGDDLVLDWWQKWSLNPAMKLWAGQQTATTVLKNLVTAAGASMANDWLTATSVTTGRLGVDCMGTWNALSMGWSLNEHKDYQMLCRPFIELLAFVGLQGFPLKGDRHSGFEYHPWRAAPYNVARLAFAGASHYALPGFTVGTTKAGSNTILLSATAKQEQP